MFHIGIQVDHAENTLMFLSISELMVLTTKLDETHCHTTGMVLQKQRNRNSCPMFRADINRRTYMTYKLQNVARGLSVK